MVDLDKVLAPAKVWRTLCMACGASNEPEAQECSSCGTCRKFRDGNRIVFVDSKGNVTAEWTIPSAWTVDSREGQVLEDG